MDYKCVITLDEISQYIGGAKVVAFDFETAPLPQYRNDPKGSLDAHRAHIVGISLSVEESSAIYIPIHHICGGNMGVYQVVSFLKGELWMNPDIIKVAHNLAFESMFLYALGVILQPPCYDTIAAAQMTLKNSTQYRALSDSGLKTLVPALFDVDLPDFNTVTAGRHFDELLPQDAETIRYACADADYR